ncbi:unnamed protein product [Coccothraustes coccothraustes]
MSQEEFLHGNVVPAGHSAVALLTAAVERRQVREMGMRDPKFRTEPLPPAGRGCERSGALAHRGTLLIAASESSQSAHAAHSRFIHSARKSIGANVTERGVCFRARPAQRTRRG